MTILIALCAGCALVAFANVFALMAACAACVFVDLFRFIETGDSDLLLTTVVWIVALQVGYSVGMLTMACLRSYVGFGRRAGAARGRGAKSRVHFKAR